VGKRGNLQIMQDLVIESFIQNPTKVSGIDYSMKIDFGKYKDTPVFRLPKHYRNYLLEGLNTDPLLNETKKALRDNLELLNKTDISDLF
jgi:hypothetical protein